MWRRVAQPFKQEYKTVLFDYVGSGHSDMSAYDAERYGTLQGYATDVIEVCEALDLRQAILVGHSVSSMTCMLAAIATPERTDRLVMVCPSPRYLNDPPEYEGGFERADIDVLLDLIARDQRGWAKYMAGIVVHCPGQTVVAEELEATFCGMEPQVARRFAAATFLSDCREQLVESTTPSLILQCADDLLVPPLVTEYLHAHLPNSTLRHMNATGHCPHLTDPGETIQCIREFLRQSA